MAHRKFRGARLARVIALEAVYRWDLTGENMINALEDAIRREDVSPNVAALARTIVESVHANLEKIDRTIEETAVNWKLERLFAIDRNILRIAIGEMLAHSDTPPQLIIAEAIELAKTFSTDDSGVFVNGVLDAVAKKLGILKTD
ncbi:MAG: transcription antitermination factor NusB [Candidatus Hydrothermota bacterium]|nr:MAG: transcription antitermination factor NusB [Candidatus Hydrothermae bacterium]